MPNLLDFIIPEYNCPEDFIRRLLNSFNSQVNLDFSKLGIIIVNDCSSRLLDEKIFEDYKNLNIRYLKKDKNEGQGLARQTGIDNSEAEYIAFMDQDDMLNGNDCLWKVFDILTNAKPEGLFCDLIEEAFIDGQLKYLQYNHKNMTILHGMFLSRKHLNDNGIRFHENLRHHEDTYFCSILSMTTQCLESWIPVYLWKYNPNSQVRTNDSMDFVVKTFDDFFKACIYVYEFVKPKNEKAANEFIIHSLYGIELFLRSPYFEPRKEEIPKFEKMVKEYALSIVDLVKELDYCVLDRLYKDELNGLRRGNPLLEYIDTLTFTKEYFNLDLQKEDYFLSIIIPEYNCPVEYMKRLLNSVFQQVNVNLNEIEFVIVNDNSPKKYRPSWFKSNFPRLNIRYIISKVNQGQGLTRQIGLDNANASYVTFFDQDDDFLNNDSLFKIMSALKTHLPNVLVSDFYEEMANGQYYLHKANEGIFLHGLYMRRSFLKKNNYHFHEELRYFEDTYFVKTLMATSTWIYLQEPTYLWRNNDASIMRTNGTISFYVKRYEYYMKCVKYISKELEERKAPMFRLQLIDGIYGLFIILESNVFDGSDKLDYEEKLYEFIKSSEKKVTLPEPTEESAEFKETLESLKINIADLKLYCTFDEFMKRMENERK